MNVRRILNAERAKPQRSGPFSIRLPISWLRSGRVIFAPFGAWEKAQNGVAHHLPTSEFEFAVDVA